VSGIQRVLLAGVILFGLLSVTVGGCLIVEAMLYTRDKQREAVESFQAIHGPPAGDRLPPVAAPSNP